jgi:hypothetical protein
MGQLQRFGLQRGDHQKLGLGGGMETVGEPRQRFVVTPLDIVQHQQQRLRLERKGSDERLVKLLLLPAILQGRRRR